MRTAIYLGLILLLSSCSSESLTPEAKQSLQLTQISKKTSAKPKADDSAIHGFPNEVHQILIEDNGFLAAMGKTIVRFKYNGNRPEFETLYSTKQGLPKEDYQILLKDAEGGVWAASKVIHPHENQYPYPFWQRGSGSVAYLAKGAKKWKSFSSPTGLAAGRVTDMALSADKKRVWVTSIHGIATALIDDLKWQSFKGSKPITLFVHPQKDIVWCTRRQYAPDIFGSAHITSQFTLKTGKWHDIEIPGKDKYGTGPIAYYYSQKHDQLWLSEYRWFRLPEDVYIHQVGKQGIKETKLPNWKSSKIGECTVYSDGAANIISRKVGKQSETWMTLPDNPNVRHFKRIEIDTAKYQKLADRFLAGELRVRNKKGTLFYGKNKDLVYSFDLLKNKYKKLWKKKSVFYNSFDNESILLSPDEKYLWVIEEHRVMVGDLAAGLKKSGKKNTQTAISLYDKDIFGISETKFVRFDPSKKLALIATPNGVVCADYSGKLKYLLHRSTAPIFDRISKFIFAPDGSSVWFSNPSTDHLGPFEKDYENYITRTSLNKDKSVVFLTNQDRWQTVPKQGSNKSIYDVLYSKDGKKIWAIINDEDTSDDDLMLQVRRTDSKTINWKPKKIKKLTDGDYVYSLRLSPGGNEMWIIGGSSNSITDFLLRINLASGATSKYKKNEPSEKKDPNKTLFGRNIDDLVFTADGKYAVCACSQDKKVTGITLIDLATGKTSHFRSNSKDIQRIVVLPDQKTVWCIFRSDPPESFNLETKKWLHECKPFESILRMDYTKLQISQNGKYLWLKTVYDHSVYDVENQTGVEAVKIKWKTHIHYTKRSQMNLPPLKITPSGKHVLAGHQNGLALITIDGKTVEIISPKEGTKEFYASHLVSIPNSADFVCSADHPSLGGIYYVDMKQKKMRKIKSLPNVHVTAMAIGPKKRLWAVADGTVLCLDPVTGKDIPNFKSLRPGLPKTIMLNK